MSERIEYKVKPVERYIITRYHGDDESGAGRVTERGIHSSPHVAYEVAYALAKLDHERLGYPLDDERIQYPRHPHGLDEEAQSVFLPSRVASNG